jgi:hypothetical protein
MKQMGSRLDIGHFQNELRTTDDESVVLSVLTKLKSLL